MQLIDRTSRTKIYSGMAGAVLLALSLVVPQPAAAQTLLFQGAISRDLQTVVTTQNGGGQNIGRVGGDNLTFLNGMGSPVTLAPYGILNTTPTASGVGFTVPSKTFTRPSETLMLYFPTYGYTVLLATLTRYNKQLGPFAKGNQTATLTINQTNSNYPFQTSTLPSGLIRLKPGTAGFAGPMPLFQYSKYFGTKLSPAGTAMSSFVFIFPGPSPFPAFGSVQSGVALNGGYSYATNQTLTQGGCGDINVCPKRGAQVAKINPHAWGITGTITAEQPQGAASTINIITAMDNRTPNGKEGQIQLINSRLFQSYNVQPLPEGGPPPLDGSAAVGTLQGGTARIFKMDLQLTPEPGQIALIGAGLMGLVGIWRMRRS